MTKKKPLEIMGKLIAPGAREEIKLLMPKLYDGSPLHSHVHVLNGKYPGPVLCLTAAIHGDELNGIEIIRKVINSKSLKNLNNMHGSIIAAPIVNIYGFLYQQRYLMDRRDLNRSFPGSEHGSLASRIANLFYTEIYQKSNFVIDFHTGSLHRANLPQIRAKLASKKTKELANAFGAPVILNSNTRPGSLREVCHKNKIPVIVYEAGEELRLDQLAIKFGVQGVFNILNQLGIQEHVNYKKNKPHSLLCETSAWVRSKQEGLFSSSKRLGNLVKQGEKLGFITNPMTMSSEVVKTPISGIIIGINNLPLAHEGSALFNIASPEKLTKEQLTVLEMLDNDEVESILSL